MKAKQWYQSKTMWLSILQLIAGIIGVIIGLLQQPDLTLPSALVGVKAIVDMWVRFKTSTTIK